MPGEKKEDLEEARRNLRRVRTNWFNIACASPIVGSDMHSLAKSKKYIKIDNLGADYRRATIQTEDFTADFIQDFQYLMNLELNFVFNADIECGEYRLALKAFTNVIRLRPDHAFAHYFSAVCYRALGEKRLYQYHFEKYMENCSKENWYKWVEQFNLARNFAEFCNIPEGAKVCDDLYKKCERNLIDVNTD